jgi:hypothetical protein
MCWKQLTKTFQTNIKGTETVWKVVLNGYCMFDTLLHTVHCTVPKGEGWSWFKGLSNGFVHSQA